jgi:ABC-type multidrug transport system ATPase subunit
MLTGLVEPSAGEILFNGEDVRRDFLRFKKRIGYFSPRPSLCAVCLRSSLRQ